MYIIEKIQGKAMTKNECLFSGQQLHIKHDYKAM